jgi:hypothetical protein
LLQRQARATRLEVLDGVEAHALLAVARGGAVGEHDLQGAQVRLRRDERAVPSAPALCCALQVAWPRGRTRLAGAPAVRALRARWGGGARECGL